MAEAEKKPEEKKSETTESPPEKKSEPAKETEKVEVADKPEAKAEDKDKPPTQTQVSEKVVSTNTRTEAPKPEVKQVTPQPEGNKGRKFSFSVPGLARKKTPPTESEPESSQQNDKEVQIEPVTEMKLDPVQTINELDGAIKVLTESESEKLSKQLSQHIEQAEDSDVVTIRLRKKTVVIVLGLFVGVMWSIPVAKLIQGMLDNRLSKTQEVEQTEEIEEASDSAEVKIRVKYTKGQNVDDLVARLKEADFDSIEMNEETIEEVSGIEIATKAEGVDLGMILVNLLKDDFEATSSSAVLSDDSDFDAVILVGE